MCVKCLLIISKIFLSRVNRIIFIYKIEAAMGVEVKAQLNADSLYVKAVKE